MAESLKKRNEVPEQLKWDLNLIYQNDEAMFADLKKAMELADQIEESFKDRLNTAENIVACMDLLEQFYQYISWVEHYTSLAVSVDYTDADAQKLDAKVSNEYRKAFGKLSFIEGEIAKADEAQIEKAIEKTSVAKQYLRDILREKPHQLSPETEFALTTLEDTLNASYELYEQTKLADMKFPDFEVGGKSYPLGYSLFEDNYEYEKDTKVRRAAFAAFSSKLKDYMYTTAGEYQACVKKEKHLADLRKYESVFDYLLFPQKVTREMYDRQIDLIMEKLAPHMRRYAKLLKRTNHLDRMTYADLKIALDPEYDPHVTIEQSKEYILDGLSVLGEEYGEMLKEAYANRWVDFAQNEGKSTGGFCASPYQKGSFILLSWNERMSDVFTLAHELGHAGHFRLCHNAQSYLDSEVSTYAVEAPSTMNELLMAEYLKEKSGDDKRLRRWVLSAQISNTYYHNFVTHLLEAAYQREVYKLIDQGEAVPAETLNEIYRGVLEKFWGDAVELTDGCELTWMRQPHYYMGLYSYCYSASLTIATQVAKRIRKEGQPAVEDWKKTMAAGGTVTPAEFAQMAGVDVTTDAALNDTIEYIGSIIDEIEALTDELEKQ
ncbi:MAG: oligoendopeptidase F [Lachnospiraceae bacterium]|nr:oligoendopeptidase F [Lachnospiraceae bacterium]